MKRKIQQLVYPILRLKPNFLIIGTQKAGTTSLARYLEQHEQIISNSSWKEVHYFNNEDNYKKGIGWYLSHFPYKFGKDNCISFEATPEYLFYDFIAERIKQDLGAVKLIIILREPSKRAYSAWKMYHSFGNNPHSHLREKHDRRTFTEAINQELENADSYSKHDFYYIERGKYFEQIKRYLRLFPKDRILILDFNYLQKDLNLLLNKTSNFLNISCFEPATIDSFKNKQYNQTDKKQLSDNDLETMASLKKYFVPYNEKLYELVDYDFKW